MGAINASDILLASASSAIVIGFHSQPDAGARELAAREKVDIRGYNVIYEAVTDVEAALKGLLEPEYEEEVVGTADNADEGIDSIRKLKPDVAVLDIRMPSGSGIVILEAVKREEGCPCIIMLTNYPYPQYRKKCMDAGADYFFDKSSEFEKVTEIIRQLLQDSKH